MCSCLCMWQAGESAERHTSKCKPPPMVLDSSLGVLSTNILWSRRTNSSSLRSLHMSSTPAATCLRHLFHAAAPTSLAEDGVPAHIPELGSGTVCQDLGFVHVPRWGPPCLLHASRTGQVATPPLRSP